MQEALITADERKLRLLARAVASGVLAIDDAEIDQERFVFGALVALKAACARHSAGPRQRDHPRPRPCSMISATSRPACLPFPTTERYA